MQPDLIPDGGHAYPEMGVVGQDGEPGSGPVTAYHPIVGPDSLKAPSCDFPRRLCPRSCRGQSSDSAHRDIGCCRGFQSDLIR